MQKTETIYCRVITQLKQDLLACASRRGEAESVVVRDALRDYLHRQELEVSSNVEAIAQGLASAARAEVAAKLSPRPPAAPSQSKRRRRKKRGPKT